MSSTSLSIQVRCKTQTDSHVVDYFGTQSWTPDSEREFLAKVRELFSLIRGHSHSLELDFRVLTNDLNYLKFILERKKMTTVAVNHAMLSSREKEVLELIIIGMSNPEIAERLCISSETVKSHRRNILKKTQSRNTATLVTYYHQTFFEK